MLAVEYDTYGGPEVLKLRRIAAPKPGPNDVLIDVHAVSMNPIDWKVRSGHAAESVPDHISSDHRPGRRRRGRGCGSRGGCDCSSASAFVFSRRAA